MKKLVYLLIAVSLMLALVPAVAYAEPISVDLIAGGGNEESEMDVGQVDVWNDGDNLYVKYLIIDQTPGDPSDNWCITETHLQVAISLDGIPQKNGNPIPGKFEENDEHDCVTEVLYTYSLAAGGWDVDDDLYIAAHAVVQKAVGYEDPNLDNFAAALPAQVTMSVTYPYGGGPSYFPQTTVSGGTVLDGVYEGWCADTDHVIYQNTNYTANVYSSYETLPAGLVEYPENLDLVNWIINQGFVGQPSSGCSGNYTYGDVQRAIWALIEDNQSTSGLGSWSQCRVDEIVAAAYASGEGFVPGCDDYVAVILQPVDPNVQVITIAQVTFASVGVPCEPIFQYETAWGAGFDFPGKNWATYLTYIVQSPGPTVEPGEPADKLKGFAVRYRSFGNTGGDEIYLGRGDLGVAGNRAQRNFGYTPWGASNGITFTYDQANDKLTTAVDIGDNGSVEFTLEYPNLASQVAALGTGCTVDEVDFMILSVVGRDAGTTVDFNNVMLDSYSLGNYSGTGGWFNWTVTGFDFSQGFTVTGDLLLSGTFGTSQELSKVEMLVGCYP